MSISNFTKYFVFLVFLSIFSTQPAFPVNFTVDTVDDLSDDSPGDGFCNTVSDSCSLRAAIDESNALAGSDSIDIPMGTYLLTSRLVIDSSIAISGEGADQTIISGNESVGVMRIDSPDPTGPQISITLSALALVDGRVGSGTAGLVIDKNVRVSINDTVIRGHDSRIFGGGISNSGNLTLRRVELSENTLPAGGGGLTSAGGGIFNFGSGILNIYDSLIYDNFATRGGGINNNFGRMEIINTTISGNHAIGGGGGIRIVGDTAIANISFTTITGNLANQPSGDSGAEPRRWGGGIQLLAGARVNMANTIVAGNEDDRSPTDAEYSPDCFSEEIFRFTSHRDNIVGILTDNCVFRDTIFGNNAFNQVGTPDTPLDPGLFNLGNNGGATRTHALRSDSPAIDSDTAVTSATLFDCVAKDQRGYIRPIDGDNDGTADCDIGAYESGSNVVLVTGFMLVDTDTDTDIAPLIQDDLLDLNALPTNLSVRAITLPEIVGSAVFTLDFVVVRTENVAPYTLAGDADGDFNPFDFEEKTYRISARPYTNADGEGTAGSSLMINFRVIRGPAIDTLLLINAETDTIIEQLFNDSTLNLATLPSSLNIAVETLPAITGSVVFGLNGDSTFRTENGFPYALGGDNPVGDHIPFDLSPGSYQLTATAFDGASATGQSGSTKTFAFDVIDKQVITRFILVDADTGTDINELFNGDALQLSILPGNVNIRVETGSATVGSVVFDHDGTAGFNIENVPPYALAGDNAGIYNNLTLATGSHTVQATPYVLSNGNGSQGISRLIRFFVTE